LHDGILAGTLRIGRHGGRNQRGAKKHHRQRPALQNTFEEHTQNGDRCECCSSSMGGPHRSLCASKDSIHLYYLLHWFREKKRWGVSEFQEISVKIAKMPDTVPDVSWLVGAWAGGDAKALEKLLPLIYPELRRIARRHLAGRPRGQTLDSSALVNEAYLKLVRAGSVPCESRAHLLSICAQMMRRILIDHARSKAYGKRGGGATQVTLNEGIAGAGSETIDLLALDRALEILERLDPRKARMIELRYFGGLTVTETAEVLRVSEETVKRDWKLARAWLRRQLE
jgi:RNA polymerase sigma factor (TIGR02999 family)